jgi:hypothetical protein
MKAPTPGIRVRTGTPRVVLGAGLDLPLHGRELAIEVGDEGEEALEPAVGGRRQGELGEEAPPSRAEELGAPVLDALAGEEGVDAVLERGAQAGEADVVAEKLPQLAQLARRHVGLGEQVGAQEVGERACVDGVRLHARGGDRLRVARMGEVELDPLALEQVGQPLPAEGGLESDPRFPSQLGEEGAQRFRVIRHPAREELQALLVEGGNVRGPAMEVDADVDHGGLLSDPELATSA